MSILSSIMELREYVDERVRQAAARIVWFAPVSNASATGDGSDAVEGHAVAGGEPSYQIPVRRMEPFGFRSVPPTGIFGAVVKAMAGASNGMLIGTSSQKYGPTNLKSGESCQFCSAATTRVWLDANGVIHIDAAPGQDIVLNGGTLKVARVTDPLQGTAGPYPIAGVIQATGGAPNVKA